MLILCTNDDGYLARGLGVLSDAARTLGGEVHVVAPDREQSATSHSLTMHLPLRAARWPSAPTT
jgi:5'-nucleotidase